MDRLRVWWSRNVPSKARYFKVNDVEEAKKKIEELTQEDLKNKLVEDNVGGLEIFEDGKWSEYYNEDGNDIMQILKEDGQNVA